ncbi:hypothetical protein C8R44DRAFT_740385 [Mycena epipterygia]|nr:hypothetical protein C8R44DRAFT_740385 [Mycena epipterygia]
MATSSAFFRVRDVSSSQPRRIAWMPPHGRVYRPGPATIFLTVDEVTSIGVQAIVGGGTSPAIVESPPFCGTEQGGNYTKLEKPVREQSASRRSNPTSAAAQELSYELQVESKARDEFLADEPS